MPTRKRALFHFPPGSGGGAPPTAPNIAWGPDFGEANGADGITHQTGVQVRMPALAMASAEEIGVQMRMPALAASYAPTPMKPGVHMAGTVLGPPQWEEVQTATDQSAVGVSSLPVSRPTRVVGDLWLAFISWRPQVLGSVPGFSVVDAGWTLENTFGPQGALELYVGLFSKLVDGTEDLTINFSFNNGAQVLGEVHRISSPHPTTPIDNKASSTGSTTDPNTPSITTNFANELLVSHLYHDHGALSQTHTPPGGSPTATERTDFQSTLGALIQGHHSFTAVHAAAGAQGTRAHDCTEAVGTDFITVRVAVRPGTRTLAT